MGLEVADKLKVNTTRNYSSLMGFGHWDAVNKIVVVDKSLLQGGIVSGSHASKAPSKDFHRLLCTIFQVHSSDACGVAG